MQRLSMSSDLDASYPTGDTMQLDRILSPREAWRTAGVSRSTMYRLEKEGRFPRRLQISVGRTGYLASELDAWLKTRAACRLALGKNDE